MNRVFKVIWSKTRNAYTVVSEIARTHGKSKTSKALKALPFLIACFLGSGLFSDVNAYTYTNTIRTVEQVKNDGSNFVANSSNITSNGDFSPDVGNWSGPTRVYDNQTYYSGVYAIRNLPQGISNAQASEIKSAIYNRQWNQYNAENSGAAVRLSNSSGYGRDYSDDVNGNDDDISPWDFHARYDYENLSAANKKNLDDWLQHVIDTDDLQYNGSSWYSKSLGYSVISNWIDTVGGEDAWTQTLTTFNRTDDAAVTLNNSTVTGKANSATSKAVNVTNGSTLSIAGNVDYGSLSVADSKVTVGGNAVIESGDLTSTGNSTVDVSKGTLTLNKGAVKMSKGGVLKAMVLRAPAAAAESEIGSNTKIDGSLTVAGQIHGVTAGNAETDGANVSQTLVLENGINSVVTEDGSNSIGQKQFKIDVEGKGKAASGDTGLINGDTLYNEVRPAEDGTYVTRDASTAENLSLLDEQVADNTTSINNNAANINKLFDGEFSNVGQTAIKNLAKDAVTVSAGDHVNVKKTVDPSSGNADYKVSVIADGKVASGDSGLVTGDTVNKAINDALLQSDSDSSTVVNAKLANKADVDAGNIGNNMKNPDGSNASEADKKANSEAWGNAIGTGKVEKGSKELVTGDTVNTAIDEVNSKIDGNKTYVDDELKKKANVDGSNIDKDKFSEAVAVGTVKEGDKRAVSGDTVNKAIENVTNNMNTELSNKADTDLGNISENGQKVIQNLAKGSIDIVDGHNTKVSKNSVNGKDIYSIDVSDKDIIDAMKPEMDKKADKDEVNKKFDEVDKSLSNKADRDAGNLTEKDISSWQDKLGNGTIEKGNTGLINGNTAYEAVKELKDSNPVQSDGKIITIGAKDTASVVDFRNSDGKGRVLTGIVTDVNDRSSAANAGYVQDTAKALQEQMNSGYSRLDKNISKAAAGSNALAALHPLDYDPEDKVNFAVGYGHYRDANAAAVGAFYYPNANMMLSVGATVGNGASGVNAGLSVKLGKGSPYAGVSKTKLAEAINKAGIHIVSLEKENAAMKQKNEALQERLDKQDKEITELKAMVSSLMNH